MFFSDISLFLCLDGKRDMIKTISISNYKGLKEFSLKGCRRFNLIVGMNNSGKSSLLEALYLYCSGFSPIAVGSVLQSRGYLSGPHLANAEEEYLEALASLFSGREVEDFFRDSISITGDNQRLECKLVNFMTPSNDLEEAESSSLIEFEKNNARIEIGDRPRVLVKRNGENLFSYDFGRMNSRWLRQETIIPCQLVRTAQISRADNPTLFDRITMTPKEKSLVSALQLINPQIDTLNFLKTNGASIEQVPYVALRGANIRVRLSSMGDGVNRILSIILALLNCEHGVLFLDEFENGLHYSVQEKLWQIIIKLSNDLDIQVFATTHSNDCLKSFVSSGANRDGLVARMESKNSYVYAVPMDSNRLAFALENHFDVR